MRESGKRVYRAILIVILVFSIKILFTAFFEYFDKKIPSVIYMHEGCESKFDFDFPATGQIISVSRQGVSNIPKDSVIIDLNDTVSINEPSGSSLNLVVKLFGLIPVKQTRINIMNETQLIPMGIPIGIYVETQGVMVVGIGEIINYDGEKIKPAEHILKSGDYIEEIDGQKITAKDQVTKIVADSKGKILEFLIKRNDKEQRVKIIPILDQAGEYKIGIWLRDNTQGIGTLTFIDSHGNFGALGHGITDVDTGLLMDMKGGLLYKSGIVEIKKGSINSPGEMVGMIVYSDEYIMGNISDNTVRGIFGSCNEKCMDIVTEDSNGVDLHLPMPVGFKQEIKKDKAQILCTVDDETRYYDIVIKNIHMDPADVNHQIELEVVDEDLLSKTGGIVQGMSGSPIIQDGKIIGAVTHVLVNDPTKGYGIFIENMLEH